MNDTNQIFYNAARDNEQLLDLIAAEKNEKLKLIWEYHRFLNYEIMKNVLNNDHTSTLKNVQEMKRSLFATKQYLKMI
jgi:hypothetical protein